MACPVAGDGFTIGNSNNELIGDLPSALSDIYSHGMTSELPDRIITEFTAIDDAEPVDEVIKIRAKLVNLHQIMDILVILCQRK